VALTCGVVAHIGIRFGADYLVSLSGSRYNKVRAQLGLAFKHKYLPRAISN
jgi:hypothetical protein